MTNTLKSVVETLVAGLDDGTIVLDKDLGPGWDAMKQDMPDHRLKTAQDRIAENNLDHLRDKLTSWPALFSKRYEVARALALGWWHQLTPKEKSDMADKVVFGTFCFAMVVIAAWLALR